MYSGSCSLRLVSSVLCVLPLAAYTNRVPAGHAGVPGETNPPCTNCHTVTLNPAGGNVQLDLGEGRVYFPGRAHRITVRIVDPDVGRRYGFQLAARTTANAQAGSFAPGAGTAVTPQGGFVYINHTASAASYAFDWIAPADAVGLVRLYVAGMAARGTRDSRVYTTSVELSPAAAPSLRPVAPVVSAASFQPRIAPGSWISLFGQNLAPPGVSRIWTSADIVDGVLPRSLEGVSVTVNDRPAAVYFVSPQQVNVQAPDDEAQGMVEVRLTTATGTAAATVNLSALAPGVFALPPHGYRYPAAVHADGTLAAPAGLYGGDTATRPAKPGDILMLFATGLGRTELPVAAGRTLLSPSPLADPTALRVRVGNIEAQVLWAGIVAPGLYQINLAIPELPSGEHSLTVELAGAASQPNLYLPIASRN